MIFQWRGFYYIKGGKTLIYGRGNPPFRKRKASGHPFHRPSIFILSRWITKHQVLVSLKSSFITSSPCPCLEFITVGSVEQSRTNWSRCLVVLLHASRTSLYTSSFSMLSHIEITFLLDWVYAVHLNRICSTVSYSWNSWMFWTPMLHKALSPVPPRQKLCLLNCLCHFMQIVSSRCQYWLRLG